ncbi:hypothetical protein Leryth_017493, partial [Lithospermum erythrorhizon]
MICIIRNPITLQTKKIVISKERKVVARVPGVPGISPSPKNAIKCCSNDR